MEGKLIKVRRELDELGYYQPLSKESTPLVERLLADLKTTTSSLQKYMKIAQKAIEERDNLQLGAQPFKCDNARLVKECNDLHLKFIKCKEDNDCIRKSLERRIEALKGENFDLEANADQLRTRIQNLELEIVTHSHSDLGGPAGQKSKNLRPALKSSSTTALLKNKPINKSVKSRNFELNSAMALADQKVTNLTKEIKKLKDQNLQLADENESLQNQLMNRDGEIARLNNLLEGGRPLTALNKDCCCKKGTEAHYDRFQDDINKLSQEKHNLETQLKESLAKQHEAMKRALHLAERNKMLENEMKDIDHLALAVEAECNNTVKNKTEMIQRLQDRMHATVLQIQTLERENAKLKQEKQELSADMDAVTLEKKHLQNVLETSLDEKKRLTDRINNFTIIERDLNAEIDRLMQTSAAQKRRIAELECNLLSEKAELRHLSNESGDFRTKSYKTTQADEVTHEGDSPSRSPTRNKGKSSGKKSVIKSKKGSRYGTKSPTRPRSPQTSPDIAAPTSTEVFSREFDTKEKCCRGCCDSCLSAKHLKELLDKELDYREQQSNRCIDSLKSEKEYYMKEYQKLLEQLRITSGRPETGDHNNDLIQKLSEKEQSLMSLQQENRILSQEKYTLMNRLETARDHPSDTDLEGVCLKSNCKRTERDRELLRIDVGRLEEENDSLKCRMKSINESLSTEKDRLQKCLCESESQVRKLEQERRELMQNSGSRRAAINVLEEENSALKDQLRGVQNELNHQRALYSQLKTLHEQTDRALSDTQGQLTRLEAELADSLEKLRKRDQDRGCQNKEADMLRNDLQIMKTRLTQIDKEKDDLLNNLDEKTERLTSLEIELKSKDKTVASLEATVDDLKRRINATIDDGANQGHLLRSCQSEISNLQQEIESLRRLKDGTLQENRRLQDDLTAATCDCRDSRKELEICKRQVEDLKTQLQHYVAEVKRTEDLISNKEVERNELLDQFRSLSQEANILESNNHTLETEATQTRVQLSVALDHTSELERKLHNQEAVIQSYERQIADLTSQVASLEMQTRQCNSDQGRTEFDLNKMRELCLKLDTENQKLKRQVRDFEDQCLQECRKVDQLRSEKDALQSSAARERQGAESLDRLASESKREVTDLKLLNQDLKEEVQRLKAKVQDLQDVFNVTSERLEMYQEKALEYGQQNKQLRREIANERFRRTRDSNSTNSKCACINSDYGTRSAKNKDDVLSDGFYEVKGMRSSVPTTLLVKTNTERASSNTPSKRTLMAESEFNSYKHKKSVSESTSDFKRMFPMDHRANKLDNVCPSRSASNRVVLRDSQTTFHGGSDGKCDENSPRKDIFKSCIVLNEIPGRSYTANYTIVHESPLQVVESTKHK